MKTQTDTANLKRMVVKRVLGRGGEGETHDAMMVKAQPSGLFALMETAFKATQDSLKEERWQQEAGVMVLGEGAALGLMLRAQLTALGEPGLGLRLCGRCLGPQSNRMVLKSATSGG